MDAALESPAGGKKTWQTHTKCRSEKQQPKRSCENETVMSKQITKPSRSKNRQTLELTTTKSLKFRAEFRCALHCDEWIFL